MGFVGVVRRLSPLQIIGLLAGISILPAIPWRALGRTLSNVIRRVLHNGDVVPYSLEALVNPLLSVWLTYIGAERFGIAVSWLLLAYLVYQYTPKFYPQIKSLPSQRGFRTITTVLTLCIGVSLELDPGSGPTLLFIWVFIGMLCYYLYLKYIYGEPSLGSEKVTILISDFSPSEELQKEVDSADSPGVLEAVTTKMLLLVILMIPSVLSGYLGFMIHFIYPLPEIAILVGVVIVQLDRVVNGSRRFFSQNVFEIDLVLLKGISGTQNMKGLFMIMFCYFGVLISGASFFFGFALFFGFFVISVPELELEVLEFLVVGFLLLTIASYLFLGGYGLFYWIRQMKRVEPYAIYWSRCQREEATVLPPAPCPRPPGLLLPFSIYWIWSIMFMISINNFIQSTISSILVFCIVTGIILGSAGWSIRWTYRTNSPQSLENESTTVLAALLFQVVSIGVFFYLGIRFITETQNWAFPFFVIFLLLITIGYYTPEISFYAAQWNGKNEYLFKRGISLLHTIVICTLLFILHRVAISEPPFLLGLIFVAIVLAMFLVSTFDFISRYRNREFE